MMRHLLGTLLILLTAFFQYEVCAHAQKTLFSSPPNPVQIDLPSVNPYVVLRQGLVTVQTALLDAGGESTVCLNPFEDICLNAEWEGTERNADGGYIWFGRIEQSASFKVVFVWDGAKMAGSITTVDRKYTVRHLRDELHLVRELDLTGLQQSSSVPRSVTLAVQGVPSDFETEVLDLVNQERSAENLGPLSWDTQLHEAALAHSEDMAANDYFSHTSLDGRTATDRIEDAGYLWSAAGENIAAGYLTPQAVVNGWMNSAGHRQNILSTNYCDLGVGYAYDAASAYGHYWTQDFGRRSGVSSCPSSSNQAPSAGFIATPVSGPYPLVVQFDGSSSADPEGEPLSFSWAFGDGEKGAGKTPSHTYATAGVFTVTLTVVDTGGASDSLTRVNFITVGDSSANKYTLIVNIEGQGTATINSLEGTYAPGTVVNVTAVPSSGWEFSGWTGDIDASDNPVSIVMDSSKSVTATFAQGGHSDPVVSGSSGGGCFIATIGSWF